MSDSSVLATLTSYVETTFLVRFDDGTLSPGSNLFDAGVIDSYGVVEMVGFIEREFGVSFTDEELLSPSLASVAGMSEMVERKLREEGRSDLQAMRSS